MSFVHSFVNLIYLAKAFTHSKRIDFGNKLVAQNYYKYVGKYTIRFFQFLVINP